MAILLRSYIAKYMHFREKSSVFCELDDKYISFLHVLNVSLNYDQKSLGYRFSEWWCCQKIMPFHLKYQFRLGKRTNIYEFGDRFINFFDVLGLLSFSVIRTPWGIVSVKGSVARKSVFFLFYLNCKFCLGPIAIYAYILDRTLQYFTSLMTSIYHFLVF